MESLVHTSVPVCPVQYKSEALDQTPRRLEQSGAPWISEEQTSPGPGPALPRETISAESSCSDARLVSECRSGNEEAWAALIHKYKRLIYSIPIKYGLAPADGADVFQSVCLELFCELRNLRKADALKAWLMIVTSRKCLQWKKERRAETDIDTIEEQAPDATVVSAPELLEEVEKEQCLREGVAQLPARCRELVRLLFYEHPPLPYAEVAKRLGLATGSIGFTRGRCLDKLQKILVQMGF